MRIIAGRHRGRRLNVPRGTRLRPTAERGREMVFDVLTHRRFGDQGMDHLVLDAFCGVGSLALEALSRGAEKAILIDQDQHALKWARANACAIKENHRCWFLRADLRSPPAPKPDQIAGLFFLDPPYGQALVPTALTALAEAGWLTNGAVGVAELARNEDFIAPPAFSIWREKSAGAGRFVFLTYQGRSFKDIHHQ